MFENHYFWNLNRDLILAILYICFRQEIFIHVFHIKSTNTGVDGISEPHLE